MPRMMTMPSVAIALFFVFFAVLTVLPSPAVGGEEIDGVNWKQRDIVVRPIIVAHRGASGMLPEHTVEAYREAISQGADYIECDAVLTKDGILVCRHEPDMSETTDVASRADFKEAKKKTYTIDGRNVTGYFTIDFTLEEIKRLRAVQRLPFRDQSYNGQFQIPTLEEYLDVALSAEWDRRVGIYVETKRPTWHEQVTGVQKKMEDALLEALAKRGIVERKSLAFLESFSRESLKYLNNKTDVKLVQLLGDSWREDVIKANQSVGEALDEISTYADAIGPLKSLIVPVNDKLNKLTKVTDLVEQAHFRQLEVHPWVFRNEFVYLPFDYGQDPVREYTLFVEGLKVDGLFTDFPFSAERYLRCAHPQSLRSLSSAFIVIPIFIFGALLGSLLMCTICILRTSTRIASSSFAVDSCPTATISGIRHFFPLSSSRGTGWKRLHADESSTT